MAYTTLDLDLGTSQYALQNMPSILSQSPAATAQFKNSFLPSLDSSVPKAPTRSGVSTSSASGGTAKGVQGMSGGLQSGLSQAGGFLGKLSAGKLDPDQSTLREGIRSGISSAGPIGAIIGAASGVVDAIGAATGLNLDNIDKSAAKRAGIGGAAGVTNIINSLPGVSAAFGVFGGKTNRAYKSDETAGLSSAFGGSVADIDAAGDLSRKRMLFGRKKANAFINRQNQVNSMLTEIGQENNLRKSSTYGENLASQNFNRYQGSNPFAISVGKDGMKIPSLEEAKLILERIKANKIVEQPEDGIQQFAEGGKLNVIAEGALHARKNNLVEVNADLASEVTHKGVPVVIFNEGGEINQTAEIEGGELILTKEVTDELEELYNDGTEEAMIEAGKLLATQIIEFTDDKTNKIIEDED